MTDRPIIFSAPMVRALLDGAKTQTRRLATSPLRRCEVGDRLYVRESFALMPGRDVEIAITAADYPAGVEHYENVPSFEDMRWTPSIHMPRRLSRLTLIVDGVRVEPLQVISEADALAEGVRPIQFSGGPHFHTVAIDGGSLNEATAALTYKLLWNVLHGEESWAANPDVVALTFRVERANIDRVLSERNPDRDCGSSAAHPCEDCPPESYPTDQTRCLPCPRRTPIEKLS